VSTATLPHTGAGDLAGLGGLGAGTLLLGGALVAAGRHRKTSTLAR
jgi:LPXTG-motif cell wall-anchored protein